jgi:hypothetical protein
MERKCRRKQELATETILKIWLEIIHIVEGTI